MPNEPTKTSPMNRPNRLIWAASLTAIVAVLAALTITSAVGTSGTQPAGAFESDTTTTETSTSDPEPTTVPVTPFAPVWEGPDEASDLDALNDLDLPEIEPEEEASEEEEVAPEPDPLPEPDPANLVVTASIQLDDNDTGVLTIANDGDLPLEIHSISSDFAGFSVNGLGNLVEGGASLDFGISVDDGIFPFGPYTVYVDVSTSAGEAAVELHGLKQLQVVLIDYDVVVTTPAPFVPHGVPWATIEIINNEDFDVTLWVDEDHARITSPSHFTLNPGPNQLMLPIAAWAVDPSHVMQMQVDLSWIIGEQTVTITKMGM